MTVDRRTVGCIGRRRLIGVGLAWPAVLTWATSQEAERALREGGVVFALRHALAPGTFDPPGFRLDDCRTQRNLSDDGRVLALRIGEWFRSRLLQPARVRSSPWCRCLDTATLAFGAVEPWEALGSPRGSNEAVSAAHRRELHAALATASTQPGRFEVWVTHMFVLSDLVGLDAAPGDGLVLRAGASGAPQLVARVPPA